MKVYLSMGPEGDLYINEGESSEGNLLVTLTQGVQVALGLWDEGYESFSYERDSSRATELLAWLLENEGYEVMDHSTLERYVRNLCTPSGIQEKDGYTISVKDTNALARMLSEEMSASEVAHALNALRELRTDRDAETLVDALVRAKRLINN
jgi:hypothetical protein